MLYCLLCVILGIFITLGNFTVILVYSTEKKIRHSQHIFRLFLGVADIIVGLIVLPTAVNTILKTYQHTLRLQTPISIIRQEQFRSASGSYIYTNTTLTINNLETVTMARYKLFSLVYTNIIGFFTTVSFTVSIYLLTVSGIDRLRALSKPLRYNQNVAKRFAILSSIVCWILAIFVSVLPIFVNDLSYNITSGSFVVLKVTIMTIILYSVMIFFPLFATWIISVSTYLISKKTFDRSKNLSININNIKNQRKLNLILSLMVFAFSFSQLPLAGLFVFLVCFFIPGTDQKSPQTYHLTNDSILNVIGLTAIIISTSNSLWNCLIYSLRIKTFRKAALKKYTKIWNRINCCKLFSKKKREL